MTLGIFDGSLVLQHIIDLAHNATALPQQLAQQQQHSEARAGASATARADRPCLVIVKRGVLV